jgi:hypothetical protein
MHALQWVYATIGCAALVAFAYILLINANRLPLPGNSAVAHNEQAIATYPIKGVNFSNNLFMTAIHALTAYTQSGTGKMLIATILSLGILILFDGIFSRRISALRR